MRIICVVKFVPDVDSFEFDFENNTLIRQNVRMILNPDDACALAFALKVKAGDSRHRIEVVSMAPRSVLPHMEDICRLSVDQGTLIADAALAGSDTHVTSEVLAAWLGSVDFDCILTGSRSLDGDTSHVPAQIAECLDLDQMSGIVRIDPDQFVEDRAVFEVDEEDRRTTYEAALPAVLSLTRESGYKLPYPKYEDLQRDVSEKIKYVTAEELGFSRDAVGLNGSLTKVVKTYDKTFEKRDKTIVGPDEGGIEYVFSFLKKGGYLK
jgi:electron transfer flavoprotein beta subunit